MAEYINKNKDPARAWSPNKNSQIGIAKYTSKHLKKSTVLRNKKNFFFYCLTVWMHWKEYVRKFTDFQAKKMFILRQLRTPFSSYSISGFRQRAPKNFRSFFFA